MPYSGREMAMRCILPNGRRFRSPSRDPRFGDMSLPKYGSDISPKRGSAEGLPARRLREPALGGGFRRGWGGHHHSVLLFER
jgi:hypothetical protein